MNNLERNLRTLLNFAKENKFPERFFQILFVEGKFVHHDSVKGICEIPQEFIHNSESYKDQFDELLSQGYTWINMNLAGTIGHSVFIIVEYSHHKHDCPKELVSVNFSLPEKRIIENDWKADEFYKIIY